MLYTNICQLIDHGLDVDLCLVIISALEKKNPNNLWKQIYNLDIPGNTNHGNFYTMSFVNWNAKMFVFHFQFETDVWTIQSPCH